MRAFVTVIGKDKIGIIHEISAVLRRMDVNILDISQTLLQDFFTMIMLVDLELLNTDFKTLREELEGVGRKMELSIKIQREDIFKSMHTI